MKILTLLPWFVFIGYHRYSLGLGRELELVPRQKLLSSIGTDQAQCPGDGGTGEECGRCRDPFCPSPSFNPNHGKDGDFWRCPCAGKTGGITVSVIKTQYPFAGIQAFQNLVWLCSKKGILCPQNKILETTYYFLILSQTPLKIFAPLV